MKQYLQSFLFFLFTGIPFLGSSQHSTLIGTATANEYANGICADNAGNTYIGGTINDQGIVIKRNAADEILWTKTLTLPSSAGADVAFIDVIGDTLFGCGWNKTGTQVMGGMFFKLNATTGQPYWIKSETTSNTYFSCMRYANGRFFLVGAQVNGATGYNAKVFGVSSSTGNTIWQTPAFSLLYPPVGLDHVDDIASASEMVNGKMFLTGRSYVDNSVSTFNMRPLFIGIDDNGTIFLNKYLLFNTANSQDNRFYGQQIQYDGPDSLVVAFFGDDNCSSCGDYKMGLMKTDLQGTVSWARYYDVQGVVTEVVRGVNVTANSYVLYGYGNHNLPNTKLIVLKTSKLGIYQDARLIEYGAGAGNMTVISGLNVGGSMEYKNNRHYMTGSYYTTNQNSRDIAAITMDDNLDDPNSCFVNTSTSVGITSFTPFSSTLIRHEFPNTVTFQNGNQTTDYALTDACGAYDVDFSQVSSCTDATITATVSSGFLNPQYSWSNGASGATVNTTSTDTLIVTVSNSSDCCVIYDTVVPVFQGVSGLTVSLPADTTICLPAGTGYSVTATSQNGLGTVSYVWSDGTTGATIEAESGTYWVDASDNCTTVRDSIVLIIHSFPGIVQDDQLSVCEGIFPVMLSPVISDADSIAWSDGSTANDYVVDSAGVYTISAFNSCGTTSFPVSVTEVLFPDITLVPVIDTCIAVGGSVILTAQSSPSVTDVVWEGGIISSAINVSQNGQYTVFGLNECGIDSASCDVTINYLPELYLPAVLDTCFEIGTGFYYTAQGTAGNYQWSSGSTTATELMTDEGTYTCVLTNSCGSVSQSMLVSRIGDVDLFVPNDSVLFCSRALPIANLQIETNYNLELESAYGEIAGANLTESGWYYITAFNSCGFIEDSIYVELQDEQYFYLPNSFTPNADLFNELYTYKGANILIDYVRIYDRWGEMIYTEERGFTGWNGLYKGTMCKDGLYAVEVVYRDCFGAPVQFNGHVNLLR